MNCSDAKQLIRQGRAAAAVAHTTACPDCAAFAEAFAADAALLSLAFAEAEPPEGLLRRAAAAATAELATAPKRRKPSRFRNAAAAACAALFAPALAAANYAIAHAAGGFIGGHLSPLLGNVIFIGYAAGAGAAIAVAYGALPLLMAAAGNTLRAAPPVEGATA